MGKITQYEQSSSNVFADLDVPEPEEALLKSDLAIRISQLIEERGMTQKEAAALLGVAQPHISKLKRGQLCGFSVERLLRFLVKLGQEIDVVVRPEAQPARCPRVRTVFAGPSSSNV